MFKDFFRKSSIGKAVLFFAAINLLLGAKHHFTEPDPQWKSIIYSDAEGYYIYLPAAFIYDFDDVPPSRYKRDARYNNKFFTRYTSGVAMMQMPFFLVAHLITQMTDLPANGFSEIYVFFILLAATVYACWGLFLIGKMLQERFNPNIALIVISVLFLGTNLMHYAMKEPGAAHVYSFFLIAAIVYCFQKYLRTSRNIFVLLTGLLLGIIILMRPTNIIIALIFPFWNINSWSGVKERLKFLFSRPVFIVSIIVLPLLVFLPQSLYWNYVLGDFIVYSYESEGFSNWNSPKIFQVLFDVQNGWLVYSPVMIFSLIGLGRMLFKNIIGSWIILAIFCLATYAFASWWAWWFGGAYGHRCYVDYLPVLAFPLAWFFQHISQQKKPIRILTALVAILFCYYNLGLTYWYSYTAPWDGSDWNWSKLADILDKFMF